MRTPAEYRDDLRQASRIAPQARRGGAARPNQGRAARRPRALSTAPRWRDPGAGFARFATGGHFFAPACLPPGPRHRARGGEPPARSRVRRGSRAGSPPRAQGKQPEPEAEGGSSLMIATMRDPRRDPAAEPCPRRLALVPRTAPARPAAGAPRVARRPSSWVWSGSVPRTRVVTAVVLARPSADLARMGTESGRRDAAFLQGGAQPARLHNVFLPLTLALYGDTRRVKCVKGSKNFFEYGYLSRTARARGTQKTFSHRDLLRFGWHLTLRAYPVSTEVSEGRDERSRR